MLSQLSYIPRNRQDGIVPLLHAVVNRKFRHHDFATEKSADWAAKAAHRSGGTGEAGDRRHWRDGGTGVLVIGASGTGEMGGRGVSASVYRMGALEPRARQASDAFVYEFGLDA